MHLMQHATARWIGLFFFFFLNTLTATNLQKDVYIQRLDSNQSVTEHFTSS